MAPGTEKETMLVCAYCRLTCVLLLPGVPILYYGTEQGMAGGPSDNDKRQPMWAHGGYSRQSDLYRSVRALTAARKRVLSAARPDAFRILRADDASRVFAFVRGQALVVVSNAGERAGSRQIVLEASELPASMRCDGTVVCNALVAGNAQCSTVVRGRLRVAQLSGLPAVFFSA